MLGLKELKNTIKVTGPTVECPVKGCREKVARQRKSFKPQEKFKCPKHNIYISPSTFEYQKWSDNILWKEKDDLDLLKQVKKVKCESRIARDNSEDAVTWNVFRFLEKNKLLSRFLAELTDSMKTLPTEWSRLSSASLFTYFTSNNHPVCHLRIHTLVSCCVSSRSLD